MQCSAGASTTLKGQYMWDEAPIVLRANKTPSMRLLFVSVFFLAASPAIAFEADVHHGLTNWLALQAGFEPEQAHIIATFDERVDSGDTPFIDVVGLYACLAKDEISARRAGEHHFPSEGSIPGPPETREIAERQGRQRLKRSRLVRAKRNIGFRNLAKHYTYFRIRGRTREFQLFRNSAKLLPHATAASLGDTPRCAEVLHHIAPISPCTGRWTRSRWRKPPMKSSNNIPRYPTLAAALAAGKKFAKSLTSL